MHKYTKIYKIAMSFLESACSDTSINVKCSLRLKKKHENMNFRALILYSMNLAFINYF